MNKNPKKNQETTNTISETAQKRKSNLKKIAITGATAAVVSSAVAFTLAQENNKPAQTKTMKATGKNAVNYVGDITDMLDMSLYNEVTRVFGGAGAKGLFNDQTWLQTFFSTNYSSSWGNTGILDFVKNNFSTPTQKRTFYDRLFSYVKADYFKTVGYNVNTGAGSWPGNYSGPINDGSKNRNYRPLADATFDFVSLSGALNENIEPWAKKIKLRITSKLDSNDASHPGAVMVDREEYVINWPKSEVDLAWDEISTGGTNIFWPHDSKTPSYLTNGGYESTYQDWQWDGQSTDVWWSKIDFNKTFADKYINNGRNKPTVKVISYKYDNPAKALTDSTGDNQVVVPGKIKLQFGEALSGDYSVVYREIPTTVTFKWVNKQSQYTALNQLISPTNSFTMTGDKWSAKITNSNPAAAAKAIWDAKNFRLLKFGFGTATTAPTTWTDLIDFTKYSSQSAVETALTDGIPVPNGSLTTSGAELYIKNQENNVPTHFKYTPAPTQEVHFAPTFPKTAIDVLALVTNITTAIALSGKSKASTVSFNLATYQGLKVELKIGADTTWRDATSATAYYATKNVYNGTIFNDVTFTYKISNTTSGGKVYKSDDLTLGSADDYQGTATFKTDNLKKVLVKAMSPASSWVFMSDADTFAKFRIWEPGALAAGTPVPSSTTKPMPPTSVANGTNAPADTKFAYTLYYKAANGHAAGSAFDIGGGSTEMTIDQLISTVVGHNLYNETNGDWEFDKITVKLAPKDPANYEMDDAHETELWNSSSTKLAKSIDFLQANTTDKVKIDVSATSTTNKSNALVIDDSQVSNQTGIKYLYAFDSSGASTWYSKADMEAEIQKNLWDNTKGTSGDWKYNTIWVRIAPFDNTWVVRNQNAKEIWNSSTAGTKKIITTPAITATSFGGLNGAAANTKAFTLPTITAPRNSHVVYTVMSNATTPVELKAGDRATVQAWLDAGYNLWDSTNNAFKVSSIKVKFVADNAGFELSDARNTTLWDTSSTKLLKYIEPSSTNTVDQLKVSGATNAITITEPTIATGAGYHIEYEFGGTDARLPQGFKKYTDLTSFLTTTNLWDQSATTPGFIFTTLKAKIVADDTTNSLLSNEHLTTLWTATDTLGTGKTNNFLDATVKKYVDPSALKTALLGSALTASGPNDANITWGGKSTIVAQAAGLNVKLSYAFSDNDTTPPTTWGGEFKDIPSAWNPAGVKAAKKRLWMKIEPLNDSFTVSTTNQAAFKANVDMNPFKLNYTITQNDIDAVKLNPTTSSSLNIALSTPTREEFDYQFGIVKKGATDVANGDWKSYADFLTEVATLDPIEGIWDSTTNSYRISKIQMKLVNKPSGDYTLATSALIPRTIFDATSPNIWNGTSIASTPLKRMIDTSSVKADLKAGVIPETSSTNDAVDWTGAKAKVKLITDRGIKVEFLLSESVLTQGALPGATGWSVNLPTTLNEDSAKRYLYARIAPNTSTDDISTAANDRYLDLSTDSKIKDVATLIDTSTYVIDQDLIAGDTHHLTGSTTFKPASVSGLSAIKQQGFDIVYTLTNWANPGANDFTNLGLTQGTHTLKAAMTETELKALFDGTKGNLYKWGIGTSTTNSLKAKFVAKTGFKVSNAKETSLSLNHTATFKWYYDVQALIDSLKGTSAIKTDQILPLGTSRNDDIHWTNNPTTTTLRYNNEVDRIEYLSGDYSSPAQVSAAPANKWTTTLPTSIDYTHSKRNIYARIISKDGYVASNLAAGATEPTPIDLTTTSKIREVITSISDSADYAAFDISKIAFTSTTNSAAIDETPAGAAPVGSKISYQVQYYGAGNVATTSAWMDKASFITFIKNNHVLVRTIKAHLETNDATRYEVATGKDKINTCDISNFYYFNSMVNSGKTIVSSLLTKANIDIRGILSKDNGVQVKIPTALKETELAKIGLALQYSVNDGPYKNFSAATTDFTAGVSDPNGHQSASAGEYMLVKVDDLGPNKTWLRFRIIPIYQDDYTTKTTVTDENDWQKIMDDVKVKTSDIFNNSAPTVYEEDLTTLPVLVSTSNTWITAGNLNITGTSRNLAINNYTISDIGTDLDSVNSSKGYSTKIELGFRVEDGNIPANIYFKRNDFMTWLSGAAPAALSVYDASTNTMVALNTVGVTTKGSTNNDIYRKPHWNAINLDTFKARFISTDGGYRVSDSVEVALPTHTTQAGKEVYTVKKWTDLQAYLDRLKAADISGDTAHLTTTTLTAVQADLDKDFGVKDGFKIQSTPVITNGVGDWTSAKVKDAALPDEIKFTYDLAFRIIPVEDQFEASVEPAANATPATNVDVIWDKHTSTNVKKFLHIDTDKLSTITFDGTTKNLTTNIASLPGLLLADDNGVMIQGSLNRGVEIQARLKNVSGSKINAKKMDDWTELNQFILNLNDAKNVDLFDGTWGRDQIEIKYAVKTGFAADNAELQQTITPSATAIANVKRYINIDSLVTTATQNKQTGIIALSKTTNEGWWNALSSAYDDHKNWTGYIDNKNFDLKTLTIPSDLHVKVQYTIDNGQNWTDTIPTDLAADANARNLSIRFAKSANYGTEDVVTSDMTNTNNTWVPKSHDITSNSGIKSIPARIDVTNVHLENIKFTGDTRHLVEDTSTAGIPTSARVEYSLTNFVRLNSTNSTLATQAQAVLANIGITNASHPDLYAKYTGSLTFNELKTFINAIVDKNDPTLKEILRSSISARLVPNNTYSLTQTDDTNTRKAINVSGLYTFKDITKDVDFLKLATPSGSQNGINIYGTQQTANGALIQIPDALIASLAANNLKLQFTTDGKQNGSAIATILGDTPTWHDVVTQHFASNAKPGAPEMDHGFETTLKSLASSRNPQKSVSYLAFRIVPTKNDAGTDSTAAENAALTEHYDKTNTKLFTVSGTGINAQPTLQATNYDIDTSKIPTVIQVTGIDLSQITASGNTKDLSITEAAMALVDSKNPGNAKLDDQLQLLYALDKTNTDAITSWTNRNDTDLLWLTETDFEAYWHGNLVVSGGKVIHKGTTEEVEAFNSAVIAARKLKDGDVVLPNYLATSLYDTNNNKNLLLVKWVSMTKDYDANSAFIPSDTEAHPVSYSNQTFKKWFDGSRFNTAIEAATVTGTTKQYDLHFNGPASILQGLETSNLLKFQYSTNGTTWSDSKIDFTTLTWQEQVDHKIYIRVVPKSFTGTTAITGASAVAESVADGIIIDYKNDQVAGKLIKIDEVKANSTEKEFKTYLDINSSDLANIKAKGNSWALLTDAQGAIDSLDETTIDNNTAKYSQVEIQYLFNNVWYNKADLVAEMKRIRDDVTDADKAKAYVAPTDFTHQQIKARWRVLDPVNFVIASEQTDGANKISNLQNVDSTAFKTFINVWNIQDKLLNDFKADLGTQAELFDLMANSGTTVTLSGNIKAQQKLPASLFSQLNVKLQYSTAATPNDAVNSTDWFDAEFINNPASYPAIIKDAPFGVGKNLPLWFRIVPKDASESTVSTAKDDGNSAEIQRIKMDTSKLKFTIKTDSDALLQLKTSGDTQDNFTSDETPFTSAHKDASNNWVVDGIGIYVTDPTTSAKVPNPTDSQINSWLTSMGLRINYRVIPNRTAGKFIAGQAVEFTTLAELQKELKLHNLNFDRSTLNVRWDFADTQFVASDPKWITPADLQSIVNIIYTEDIFTLQPDTLLVTGNNLKVQSPVISTQQDSVIKKPTFANVVLEPSALQKDWHVKLQYNWAPDKTDPSKPDAAQWADTPPTQLNGARDYWIRYEVVDSTDVHINSLLYPGNPSQVTKVNVSKIKQAVPFNITKTDDIKLAIKEAKLTGYTIDFTWDKALPAIQTSLDGHTHGHIQYSIDGNAYSDTMAEALASSDYYQMGVLGFIKERGDKLYVRYVYQETVGNMLAKDSNDYVFTNTTGDELKLDDLLGTIDINNLIEPVWIDKSIGLLSNQQHITAQGLSSPNGNSEFADVTWRNLANFGLFKPSFVAAVVDGKADFRYMWYDGVLKDNSQNYIFGLGKNPFDPTSNDFTDPKAKDYRTDLRGLLPRHTHLEFRTSSDGGTTWSKWSETAPTNITKSSNAKTFDVRLVADQGYTLGETNATSGDLGDFNISDKFPDGSARTAKVVAAQTWSKQYNVTVELLTSDYHLPTDSNSQATFIGWDEDTTDPTKPKAGSGTFATTNTEGNHTPSMDANNLKNILVHFLGANDVPLDFENSERGFVIEWNVTNSGNNIQWTDSRGDKAAGWHLSVPATSTNAHPAPDSSVPWYGAYPVSLKNGDVVQVRLRARDGFIISKDDKAIDYDVNKKESNYSHMMQFAPITTLTHRITIPNTFALYDVDHSWDYEGKDVQPDTSMPKITFSGSQGAGKLAITGGKVNPHYHYEVAILRSMVYLNGGTEPFTSEQKPYLGYCVESYEDQMTLKQQTVVYDAKQGWRTGWKSLLETQQMWKKPADINDLNVGDAVLVRLVADAGYGFEWENQTNNFADTNYPKDKTYDFYGTKVSSTTEADTANNFNINAEQIDNTAHLYPSIVRGLKVMPTIDLAKVSLEYSTVAIERLNNGKSVIKFSQVPASDENFKWRFKHNGGIEEDYDPVLGMRGYVNGDTIEFWAVAKNKSFELDKNFNNNHITLTIDQLKDATDIAGVERPVLTIGEYDGKGTIMSIAPEGATNGQKASRWAVPDQTNLLGTPLMANEVTPGTLKWQYQVIHENPLQFSDRTLEKYTWTDTIPTDLKYGDWVRMKVATVDPAGIALANGTDYVYSFNPASQAGATPVQASWFEVKDLFIDTRNNQIDYSIDISGYIRRSAVQALELSKADEMDYGNIQFQITHKDAAGNTKVSEWVGKDGVDHTVTLANGQSPNILQNVENGDVINWRVIPHEGYTFNTNDPEIKQPEDVKIWNGTGFTTKKMPFLQRSHWTYTVSGLKYYLNTDGVEYTPNIFDGTFDFRTMIVDQTGAALGEIDAATKAFVQKTKISDGNAKIKAVDLDKTDTIKDVDGKSTVKIGTKDVEVKDIVKVRYIVKSVDPYTGQQMPEFTVNSPDVPSKLSTGDEITIELYSTEKEYQLSSFKRITFKVTGLTTDVNDPVTDPIITFTGESLPYDADYNPKNSNYWNPSSPTYKDNLPPRVGGSLIVSPQAPLRTKWVYSVIREPELQAQNLQVPNPIDELKNPDDHTNHPIDPDDKWLKDPKNKFNYYWTSKVPTDLSNGDFVSAMLIVAVEGSTGININHNVTTDSAGNLIHPDQIPMSNEWVKVEGLAEKIDLSKYTFKLIDSDNPVDPNKDNGFRTDDPSTSENEARDFGSKINFAFKVAGTQDGQAELLQNALIQSTDLTELLVDQNGEPLPAHIRDYLQWEFAVNADPLANGRNFSWTTTLPKSLKNGQYIHVRLVGKPNLVSEKGNIEIYGYNPQVFMISGLETQPSVANKMVTLVAAVAGGVAALGASSGALLFLRRRKKKFHFSD